MPTGVTVALGFCIVVARFNPHALLAPTREVPDLDGGFGIHGNAQGFCIAVRSRIDHAYLLEDRIGGWKLFLGLLLATLVG